MDKSLDKKIANILKNPNGGDFILADAKDADMAGGLAAPGRSPEHHSQEGRFRTLAEYRQLIRQNVEQGLVDIMLMSASTNEVLTIEQKIFANSHVTPAIRANDTTDIWLAAGSQYRSEPARPFRTASLNHAMCGKVECKPEERKLGADLGLFSMTFNNEVDLDRAMLQAYKEFREESERIGFRHFLEVFDPNACGDHCPADLGRFIADNITRALAGVTKKGRPVFLKIPYHGPASMESLAAYDRSVIPGILGGASGTTFDAFFQLVEARKYGARAALYGRMINNSEHQPTFIQHLRWLADGKITDPAEGVRSYHAALEKLKLRPYRSLNDDLMATQRGTAYGSSGGARKSQAVVAGSAPTAGATRAPTGSQPDFKKMSPAEKLEWNRNRMKRVFGW